MTGARTKPDQLNGSGPITSNDPSITGTYNFPVPPRSPTHTNLRFHDVQGSPPSPTAKLDELIASEAFYYADDAPAPLHVGRLRRLDQTSQPPKSPLLAPSNKPLTRSASTRVPMAPSSFSSSSASRAAATASAASQRNPSIDSAISSMSSVASGQNRKASDSTPARAMDVTNLIVQAGSPELAIQKLLDDKKALKDDSDKMWRLIEKQRAMILGLNKDLEKTVKEKDKYRRRLKEQLAIIETLSQSKPKNSLASSNQPVALPEIVPEVLKARSVQEPAPEESTPTKRSQDSVRKSPGGQQVDGQSNPLFPMSQQSPKGFSSRRGPTTPPDPSLPEAKGSATKSASTSQSRKAAPQSLPLSQNLPPHLKPTSTISPKQAVQDSGSDYEDEQGIAQLREYERDRGRRKTREEDDYDREVAFQKAQAESQGRSRSSKTAKATSKVAALSVVQDEAAMQQPLPSGRAFRAIQPPSVHEESEQTRGIGSILEQTPPLSRHDSATRTTMALPPKVAGLPLSPRPLHRPQNAPAPRLPRADIEPYSPPPTASLTFQGLPSSPRPGHRMVIQPSAPVRSESADSHTSDERLIASGVVSETNKPKRQPNELAMDFSKAGPLLKKGRNFGGWTKRFFSIDGQTLRYFEALGGAHLGSIRIHGAQLSIGATANDDETVDQTYSFQLLEPKRKDSASHIKHVLGAESQAERDSWMEVLSYLAELDDLDDPSGRKGSDSGPARLIKSIAQQAKNQMQQTTRQDPRDTTLSTSSLKSVAYNETAQQPLPITGVPHEHRHSDTPSPSTSAGTSVGSTILNSHSGSVPISAPTNGAVITNAAIWGNKVDDQKDKQKRRHLFNFRGRHSPELLPPTVSDTQSSTPVSADRPAGRRPVFGAPLIEAAHFASPPGIDVCLPAIVYRCIEYLHAKNASKEEGIFRISGSSTTIKGLEQRFDREGDVNLLDPNIECDIHVVASLFKTYLRKLPSTVLTRDLHSDFVQAIEIDDRSVKVATLHTLVRQLPEANWTLIREVSAYLITVIEDSDVNKMTIRNGESRASSWK